MASSSTLRCRLAEVIVERHGGTISATAALDAGAAFSVTLPGLAI